MSFRYKAIIEYDGTKFHGWQSQGSSPCVQNSIENAILYFTQENTTVCGAGRTDAQVHALGQVAHFDLKEKIDPNKLLNSLNYFLKNLGAVVISLNETEHSFHARFSAIKKTYIYKIVNRRAGLILSKNRAWLIRNALNIPLMQEAANLLQGKHNFKYFRYSRCQSKSSLKSIEKIDLKNYVDEGEIELNFTAISFLHKQVRMMVGAICNSGLKKITPLDISKALDLSSPLPYALTAPPYGLYLKSVEY